MPYTLSRADLGSITDPEMAFSTDRLLPPWEEIPEEYKKDRGNIYVELVSALFNGGKLPNCAWSFCRSLKTSRLPRI